MKKGFSLAELLIVVSILGLMAVIVIPNVGKIIERGKAEAYYTAHNITSKNMTIEDAVKAYDLEFKGKK